MKSSGRLSVVLTTLLVGLLLAHYFYLLGHVHQERVNLKYATSTLSIERTISYFGRNLGLTTKFWEPSTLSYKIELVDLSHKNAIDWQSNSYQTPLAISIIKDEIYLLSSKSHSKPQSSCYVFTIEKWSSSSGWVEITNRDARHEDGWTVFESPQSWALPWLLRTFIPKSWKSTLNVRPNKTIPQINQIQNTCK